MVRTSCPLITKDGHLAHPTRWNNLFFGVPLSLNIFVQRTRAYMLNIRFLLAIA
ncbi:hypothetical protein [Nostoc sp.]|uniref:hypothetical protein n=1 Tax=Nostoc sp. TaxID=1180 RepID=UPI002FF5BC32